MPNRYDDEWDDGTGGWEGEEERAEYGEAEDAYDDFDAATLPCPRCRAAIHEEAERCPRCGHYVLEAERTSGTRPWWFIAGVLLASYAVYRWITG